MLYATVAVVSLVIGYMLHFTQCRIAIKKNKRRNSGDSKRMDLSSLTISRLREMGRKRRIKGYYSMNKADLIEAIKNTKE